MYKQMKVWLFKSSITICFLFVGLLSIQGQNVTGIIVDDLGDALIGASILVEGTTTGTITDLDGKFEVAAKEGDVLNVSYIGYQTQNIVVGAEKNISVLLLPDSKILDEVVVIGYGTQKKSHTTGSISKVKNEGLDEIAVARVDEALIGQVSGVNIAATEAEAGSAPTITVRGVGSVSADTGPAVVVDGIVVDSDFLGNLDMNDVESFEILKDAASAAIYGSEGSNGVILITTKSGKDGKTKFSYNGYIGIKQAHDSPDYKKSVSEWNAFELAENGELSNRALYMEDLVAKLGVDRDWQDVFFENGLTHSHSLSARGGTKKTKFSTAFRYVKDEGVVITDDYDLFSAKLKIDTKLTDRLKFGVSINPSLSNKRRLPTSIHNPLRQSPWLPIFHTEESMEFVDFEEYPDVKPGDYFFEDHLRNIDYNGDGQRDSPRTSGDANSYAQYIEREHNEEKMKLLSSAKLTYKIMDGLTAKTSLGITREERRRERYDGILYHQTGVDRAQYQLQNRLSKRIISDNTLNYKKAIGTHDFDVLVGASIQQRDISNSFIEGRGFTSDRLRNLEGATEIAEFTELQIERNKIGYFGRVNYAFKDKYLVSASVRADASSVFGFDSKWGTFPAISVGWNVARESFLENSDIFSSLKMRLSYGITGNENFDTGSDFTDFYPYLALLQSSNSVVDGGIQTGFSPQNIANSLLQWEGSSEFNPGIDFGFAGNRVTGSIDYYKRTSDNLLLDNPVSYVTGFNSGIVNVGEVENSGFELELRTRNLVKEKFSWSTTLIATTNDNKLTDFGDSDGQLLEDQFDRNSQWINQVGHPISSFYGFVVDRELPNEYWTSPFFPINGKSEDIIVKDLNNDGLITNADKTILGDPYPDLVWSLTNEFQFGPVDLSVMIQGSHGAEVRNVGDQYFGIHWQGATLSADDVVAAGEVQDASFLQERVLTDDIIQSAEYFSVRNVTLGFNLNKISRSLVQKMKITNLRMYLSGQNIIFITADDYNGFNPEFVESSARIINAWGSQRGGSPVNRTFTLGFNLDF